MEEPTQFIGMDVHKDTIVVAVTATGDIGTATPYDTFRNATMALEKLVKRLRQAGSGTSEVLLRSWSCGYGVHRTLTKLGEECMVVAPSMIPRKRIFHLWPLHRAAASLSASRINPGFIVNGETGAAAAEPVRASCQSSLA
jgi:transposase